MYGEMKNAYKILVGNTRMDTQLRRT